MPKIWPILSQGFTNLLVRFGIQAVPSGSQWFLQDTVVPVAVVDSEVSLNEALSTLYNRNQVFNFFGAAVADAVVLSDSGALPAGDYDVTVIVSNNSQTANGGIDLQHRDAANAATIWAVLLLATNGLSTGSTVIFTFAITLLTNERIRTIKQATDAAGNDTTSLLMIKAR